MLAEQITADRNLPPFPRSTRDGYAVRSADLSQLPVTLDVIAEIKAGEKLERIPSSISSGQAAAIMTGAPVPAGADAVVMVEYTSERDHRVEITRAVAAKENIVLAGAEAREGGTLIPRGTRLNDAGIALAASVGKSKLQVYKRPRVAVLTTGDEIVDINSTPGPTQIRNSNSYSLAVQIANVGGDPLLLPIAPDEPQALRRLMEEGSEIGPSPHDRWSFHGTLRPCRTGARRTESRILLHWRENPAGTAGSFREMCGRKRLDGIDISSGFPETRSPPW